MMSRFFNKLAVKTERVYSELNANINYLKLRKKGTYPETLRKYESN